jgi:hypothetical protein
MNYVLMIVMGIIISPASAAPRYIEDFCFAQAAQKRFNGRGDREHFMANCIADLTPTRPANRSRDKTLRY